MRLPDQLAVIDHLPSLRRYALALTRDPMEADDLVQEALVRACDKRHTFRPDGDLRRWLLAILHNSFVSTERRRRTARGVEAEAATLAGAHMEPSQDHSVEVARVRARFALLPADQRAVLHLVVSEGLTYQAAAQVLNLPIGTVMSRLARARAVLREPDRQAAAPRRTAHLRIVGGADEA